MEEATHRAFLLFLFKNVRLVIIILQLKKDLDAVGKKAKAALRRAQKETKILTSNLPRKMT